MITFSQRLGPVRIDVPRRQPKKHSSENNARSTYQGAFPTP